MTEFLREPETSVQYNVIIRNNETGEERSFDSGEWDDEGSLYGWAEGNFSCDCNRHLCFLRAGGPGPPDDPHWNAAERACGNRTYTVTHAILEDGSRVEIDSSESRRRPR